MGFLSAYSYDKNKYDLYVKVCRSNNKDTLCVLYAPTSSYSESYSVHTVNHNQIISKCITFLKHVCALNSSNSPLNGKTAYFSPFCIYYYKIIIMNETIHEKKKNNVRNNDLNSKG